MKRYLIVTTVDVRKRTNNREHNLVRNLAPRFEETWVVYRRRCEKRGLLRLLGDALVPWARAHREGAVGYLEVNPLLNHYQGLAKELAGLRGEGTERPGAAGPLRRGAFLLVSGLGIFKDMTTIVCLAAFAWLRLPGRFDVCTALGPWAAAAARLLRRTGRIACYVYEDRDYEPGFIPTPLRRRRAEWMERTGMQHADRVISIGHRLAKLREAQTGRRIHVITTGVDGAPAPPLPSAGRAQVATLVYTGHVTYWSGVDRVLEALPELARRVPHVRLRVVGEYHPAYRRALEELVDALGLHDRVALQGSVPHAQIPAELAAATAGLAWFRPEPLRVYAFPLKVLEYMAAGLPTLGTVGTETADLLLRHGCGVAVPFEQDAFITAAAALLGDPLRQQAMAQAGRAAVQQYRWADLLAQEYEVLREAAQARTPQPARADG